MLFGEFATWCARKHIGSQYHNAIFEALNDHRANDAALNKERWGKTMILAVKIMEICIEMSGFCTRNVVFCIENVVFAGRKRHLQPFHGRPRGDLSAL